MKKSKSKENRLIFQLLSFWKFIGIKRKKQLFFLLILMNLNALLEIFTLTSVIPFLGILTNPEKLLENQYLSYLGISNINQLYILMPLLFGFFALFASGTRIFTLWVNGRISAAIGTEINTKCFQNILSQNYEYFLGQRSNEIINNLTIEMSKIQGLFNAILRLITASLIAIFLFSTMIIINWKLTLSIGLIIGLSYILIIYFCKKRLSENSKKISKNTDLQVKYIQEGIGSIKDIILNQNHRIYINNYRKNDIPLKLAQIENKFLALVPRFGIEGFVLFLFSIFTLYLLNFTSGNISNNLPFIGALILGGQRILPVIQLIYNTLASIQSNRSCLKRVLNYLNLNNDNYTLNKKFRSNFKEQITFDNVSYKYDKKGKTIIKEISFTVFKGEKIGIIGTTGSGKSTLLDLFMGLSSPTSGNIYVDGLDINKKKNFSKLKGWHKSISHVPQRLFFINGSISENIAFGVPPKLINMDRVYEVSKLARIDKFVESNPLGYETLVGEKGVNLSGGQLQRLAIARALYNYPRVLIFDEITSALDSKTEKEVLASIKLLEENITIIFIAHRRSTLKNCDKVFQIEDGELKKIFLKSELDKYEFNN